MIGVPTVTREPRTDCAIYQGTPDHLQMHGCGRPLPYSLLLEPTPCTPGVESSEGPPRLRSSIEHFFLDAGVQLE
jgi:hypothetical protein